IEVPEDLQGLKMRSPPIPVAIETMKAFGAIPQSIPYGETYTALQSGVVDGAEPELRDFFDAKWFEVQKYLSLSNYMWMANYWFMNADRLNGLSQDLRAVVRAAAEDTQGWYRTAIADVYKTIVADLEKAGVKVNTVDTAPFIPLAQPVYEIFADEYGADLVERVRDAAMH
ncbi:MAG: TRAP transporter substrate-binding protein, partial [Dehalococcoidia bacterium]